MNDEDDEMAVSDHDVQRLIVVTQVRVLDSLFLSVIFDMLS